MSKTNTIKKKKIIIKRLKNNADGSEKQEKDYLSAMEKGGKKNNLKGCLEAELIRNVESFQGFRQKKIIHYVYKKVRSKKKYKKNLESMRKCINFAKIFSHVDGQQGQSGLSFVGAGFDCIDSPDKRKKNNPQRNIQPCGSQCQT